MPPVRTALVGGQAADLAVRRQRSMPTDDVDELEAIHRRKTGALFVAVAGAGRNRRPARSPNNWRRSRRMASKLGLAFQITDDLLDVAGNQAAVGKRVAKDADRGKADISRTCWASTKAGAGRQSSSTRPVL